MPVLFTDSLTDHRIRPENGGVRKISHTNVPTITESNTVCTDNEITANSVEYFYKVNDIFTLRQTKITVRHQITTLTFYPESPEYRSPFMEIRVFSILWGFETH